MSTERQKRFRALGREAAFAGVGVGDGVGDQQALRDALTEACGAYAFADRSSWLVGHEQAVRILNEMAADAAVATATASLVAHGFAVERAPQRLRLYVSDGTMRWTLSVSASQSLDGQRSTS